MRAGFQPPMTATVSTIVTDDMVATLGGAKIHPVLATIRMIEWMEWAGRKLILPYLDDDEDAVGYRIDVVHQSPTAVGEEFSATAELVGVEGNRIITKVSAKNQRGEIGQGTFIQVLLPKSHLQAMIDRIQKPQNA